MELWIPITVAAAFLQNVRTGLQKHLTGRTSILAVTFARFAFGLPFALVFVLLALALPAEVPSLPLGTPLFFTYVVVGGLAQIFATLCLVVGFQLRNFAVATTLSKTETIQTAIVGIVILGDALSIGAAIAIVVSLTGVLVMSSAKLEWQANNLANIFRDKSILIGLASGGLFGIAAVCTRGASLSLSHGDFVLRACVTLLCVLIFQTAVMLAYLVIRERNELRKTFAEWRSMILIGLTGTAGSICWFAAMTLQNAAYVRAVGQLELVFTFVASIYFFREQINLREILGVLLVIGGVIFLILQ